MLVIDDFQSPFHRGNGCNIVLEDDEVENERIALSVPFSSGQWL